MALNVLLRSLSHCLQLGILPSLAMALCKLSFLARCAHGSALAASHGHICYSKPRRPNHEYVDKLAAPLTLRAKFKTDRGTKQPTTVAAKQARKQAGLPKGPSRASKPKVQPLETIQTQPLESIATLRTAVSSSSAEQTNQPLAPIQDQAVHGVAAAHELVATLAGIPSAGSSSTAQATRLQKTSAAQVLKPTTFQLDGLHA